MAGIVDTLSPGTLTDSSPSQRAVVQDGLATKPDRYPVNAYSPMAASYLDALYEWDSYAWDSTNNHIRHVSTDSTAAYGLLDDSLPTFSSWMTFTAFSVYYEGWKLANAQNDSTTASFCLGRCQAQWQHWKSLYGAQALKTGDGSSGKVIVYTLDDAVYHCRLLHAVADVYGVTSSEGQLAIGYMVEFIPYNLNYFKDSYSTNPLIDYQVSSPGGIPLKSNTYGVLYGHPGDTSFSYSSSSFEAGLAQEALWLSKQTGTGSSAPTAAMATGLQAYAKNTWAWIYKYLRTPLSQGDTRTATGLYASGLCIDPNADANHNSSINNGNPARGPYDPNKKFLVAINYYYGRPLRAVTSLWDAATQYMASLSADLSTLPSADPKYAAEALSVVNAYCASNGFGRTKDGVPLIGNLQDPHSVGLNFPKMLLSTSSVAGFDRRCLLVKSTIMTAYKLLDGRVRGRMSPDWGGEERNFVHDTWTWGDELGGGGGGVQASREQIMVSSGGLNLVQAALQFTDIETSIGSAVAAPASVEKLPAIRMVERTNVQETMTRSGGNFNGAISFDNGGLRLGNLIAYTYNASGALVLADNSGMQPTLQLNGPTTYVRANTSANDIEFAINGQRVGYFGSGGNGLNVFGPVYSNNDPQQYLGRVYGFPAVCFDVNDWMQYDRTNDRYGFNIGGNEVLRVAGNGTTINGSVTASGPITVNGNDVSARTVYANNDGQFYMGLVAGMPSLALGPGHYVAFDRTNKNFRFYIDNTEYVRIQNSAAYFNFGVFSRGFYPEADNSYPIGSSGARFTAIYATNGTIQTSDARLKNWQGNLTPAELRAARKIARQIGSYQWKQEVEQIGTAKATIHVGVIAQEVVAILEAEGLDANRYGFVVHDFWEEAGEQLERYSVRYDELAMFLASAQEQRLAELETVLER